MLGHIIGVLLACIQLMSVLVIAVSLLEDRSGIGTKLCLYFQLLYYHYQRLHLLSLQAAGEDEQ